MFSDLTWPRPKKGGRGHMRKILLILALCIISQGISHSAFAQSRPQNEEILKYSRRINSIIIELEELHTKLQSMDRYRGLWWECEETNCWLENTETYVCNNSQRFNQELVHINDRLEAIQRSNSSPITTERAQVLLTRIKQDAKLQAILENIFCQFAQQKRKDFYKPRNTTFALSY